MAVTILETTSVAALKVWFAVSHREVSNSASGTFPVSPRFLSDRLAVQTPDVPQKVA
jgi:hypothetical protein